MKTTLDDTSTDPLDTAIQDRTWLSRLIMFLLLVAAAFLIYLTVPRPNARISLPRSYCTNNLRNIAMAIIQYEGEHKQYPPLYTVDKDGNRLHSWRTSLLPNLELPEIYNAIDFSKPWGHPNNALAREQNVLLLHCPSSNHRERMTNYVAIVGPNTILQSKQGLRSSNVTDGLSKTILVVEVPASAAVHWMSPEDIDIENFLKLLAKGETSHQRGFNAAFADGSVRFIPSNIPADQLKAMLTIDGGEAIASDGRD